VLEANENRAAVGAHDNPLFVQGTMGDPDVVEVGDRGAQDGDHGGDLCYRAHGVGGRHAPDEGGDHFDGAILG
jgi:hypothetical protein